MIFRVITLYTRPGCHLCEDAASVLVAEGISFHEIDISKDSFLEKEFGLLVPVLQVDGRTVFEAGMNPGDLRSLIDEVSGER